MHKYLFLFLIVVCIGCGSDSYNGEDDQTSNIRFINALPAAESLEILVDEKVFLDQLGFRENIGYEDIHTGSHDLLIGEPNSFVPIQESNLSLSDRIDYTFIIYGTLDNPDSRLLRDDNDEADSGFTKVRFFHAARNTEPVDIYVVRPNGSIESITPAEDRLNYQEVSRYTISDSGTYDIVVTERDKKNEITRVDSQEFDGKGVYTVFLTDRIDGSSPQLLVIKDH